VRLRVRPNLRARRGGVTPGGGQLVVLSPAVFEQRLIPALTTTLVDSRPPASGYASPQTPRCSSRSWGRISQAPLRIGPSPRQTMGSCGSLLRQAPQPRPGSQRLVWVSGVSPRGVVGCASEPSLALLHCMLLDDALQALDLDREARAVRRFSYICKTISSAPLTIIRSQARASSGRCRRQYHRVTVGALRVVPFPSSGKWGEKTCSCESFSFPRSVELSPLRREISSCLSSLALDAEALLGPELLPPRFGLLPSDACALSAPFAFFLCGGRSPSGSAHGERLWLFAKAIRSRPASEPSSSRIAPGVLWQYAREATAGVAWPRTTTRQTISEPLCARAAAKSLCFATRSPFRHRNRVLDTLPCFWTHSSRTGNSVSFRCPFTDVNLHPAQG
jgi:hypothetical protein